MSYIANNARMGVILKHPALTQGAKTKTGETQVRKWRIRRVMVRSGNTFSYPGSNIVPESFDIYQSLCVAAAVLLNSIATLSEVKKIQRLITSRALSAIIWTPDHRKSSLAERMAKSW